MVIASLDGDKSPGSDGYNFYFFKKLWHLLKEEVWGMVGEFYEHVRLPKGLLSSLLFLSRRSKNHKKRGEYRPISLLGSLYKILSKMLVSRLRSGLNQIISDNQSGFLPNRNIFDGAVIINEVVDYGEKKGKETMSYFQGRL